MSKNNELFTTMPVGQAVAKLAIPTVVSQIIVILYSPMLHLFRTLRAVKSINQSRHSIRLRNSVHSVSTLILLFFVWKASLSLNR